MANLLATGATFLNAQRKAHLSETVTYSRTSTTGTLSAMRGSSDLLITEKDGTARREHIRDFIVDADDLPTGITKPKKGDRITDSDGKIYQVQNYPGHGCWRWSTGQHIAYRIHTEETL